MCEGWRTAQCHVGRLTPTYPLSPHVLPIHAAHNEPTSLPKRRRAEVLDDRLLKSAIPTPPPAGVVVAGGQALAEMPLALGEGRAPSQRPNGRHGREDWRPVEAALAGTRRVSGRPVEDASSKSKPRLRSADSPSSVWGGSRLDPTNRGLFVCLFVYQPRRLNVPAVRVPGEARLCRENDCFASPLWDRGYSTA